MKLKTTIATGTALAILLGLGTWQVQRLNWKTDLQASIDTAYDQDTALGFLSRDDLSEVSSSHVLRGKVKGRLLLDKEVVVGPRKDNAGRNAYDVITPMRLSDGGGTILVNRGRLFTENFTDARPSTGESGSILAVVTGLAQPSSSVRFPFMPHNDPENGAWIIADADEIAAQGHIEDMQHILLVAERSSVAKDRLELRDPTPPQLRNEHLQYAIFWYAMAGILLLISFIRSRKSRA